MTVTPTPQKAAAPVHDAAFDAIVASFSDELRCEMTTLSGGHCLRAARWRIDLHGCEQVNMCAQHKNAWVRQALADDRAAKSKAGSLKFGGRPRCAHCGRVFECLDEAVRITAI